MITDQRAQQVLNTLPPNCFIRAHAEWARAVTDAPLIYHVGVALALLGATAPETLTMRAGGKVLGTFWSLLVGESRASRKTTAIGLGEKIIERTGLRIIGPHPGSTEGFIQSIAKRPKQLLVFGEYGDFLSKTKEGYLAPLREKLTEVYDGKAQTRITLKSGLEETKPPRVSMLAGVTPTYLEVHTKHDDWTGGFLARHVLFMGKRERTNVRYTAGDEGALMSLSSHLALLDGAVAAPCAGLSAGAQRIWEEWYMDVTNRFPQGSIHEWSRGIAEGAPGVALKVAMLLCFDAGLTGAEGWEIPHWVMPGAIAVAETHLESGLTIVDALAPTRHEQMRRTVLKSLGGGEVKSFGSLVKAARLNLRDAKLVMDTLVVERTVKVGDAPPGSNETFYYLPAEGSGLPQDSSEGSTNVVSFTEAQKRAQGGFRSIPGMDWEVEALLSPQALTPTELLHYEAVEANSDSFGVE